MSEDDKNPVEGNTVRYHGKTVAELLASGEFYDPRIKLYDPFGEYGTYDDEDNPMPNYPYLFPVKLTEEDKRRADDPALEKIMVLAMRAAARTKDIDNWSYFKNSRRVDETRVPLKRQQDTSYQSTEQESSQDSFRPESLVGKRRYFRH